LLRRNPVEKLTGILSEETGRQKKTNSQYFLTLPKFPLHHQKTCIGVESFPACGNIDFKTNLKDLLKRYRFE
jgi:hypothetical protein